MDPHLRVRAREQEAPEQEQEPAAEVGVAGAVAPRFSPLRPRSTTARPRAAALPMAWWRAPVTAWQWPSLPARVVAGRGRAGLSWRRGDRCSLPLPKRWPRRSRARTRSGRLWLGSVAGSVASTEISAWQLRHFTVTTLPDTLRRNRSSPNTKRDLQAGQATVKGISRKLGWATRRGPLAQEFQIVFKDRSDQRPSQASAGTPHSGERRVALQSGHNCGQVSTTLLTVPPK